MLVENSRVPYAALNTQSDGVDPQSSSCCFRKESYFIRQRECSVDQLFGIANVGWGGITTALAINASINNITDIHPGRSMKPLLIGAYPFNVAYGIYKGLSKFAECTGNLVTQVKMARQHLLIPDQFND